MRLSGYYLRVLCAFGLHCSVLHDWFLMQGLEKVSTSKDLFDVDNLPFIPKDMPIVNIFKLPDSLQIQIM